MKPKTKFIIHMVILIIFAIAYIIGAMATMFNNVGATAGFGTTAAIIMIYIGMKAKVGYRTIEEQVESAAEKQSIVKNDAGHPIKGDPINRASANNLGEDNFPLRCVFRRYPEPFLVLAVVCFIAAFTGSMTYMAYAIKNHQTYDMDSYWMSFMAFLMAAKWCFAIGWFMRRLRRERNAYIATHGISGKSAPLMP